MEGFPVFPEGTKSLLSKYLTKDIWYEYHDKCDYNGYSFIKAIFSGCKYLDSEIGVYAGSYSTYETFSDLFDKIIKDYHGTS